MKIRPVDADGDVLPVLQTGEMLTCPWNAKLSILTSGGLTITFRD